MANSLRLPNKLITDHIRQQAAVRPYSLTPAKGGGWFTIDSVYGVDDLRPGAIPMMSPNTSAESLGLFAALYSATMYGERAKDFPHDIGVAIAISVVSLFTDDDDVPLFRDLTWDRMPLKKTSPRMLTVKTKLDAFVSGLAKIGGYVASPEVKSDASEAEKSIVAGLPTALMNELFPVMAQDKRDKVTEQLQHIWSHGDFKRPFQLFSFFFTLATKSPEIVKRLLTAKNRWPLFTRWANLAETDTGPIDTSIWAQIADSLRSHSASVAHYVALVHVKKPIGYELLKRWFGLRWQFSGMTMITLLSAIDQKIAAAKVMHYLRDSATENRLGVIFISTLLYVVENVESIGEAKGLAVMDNDLKIDVNDLKVGKFARLYSNTFLPWLTMFNDMIITHRLLGVAVALNVTLPPDNQDWVESSDYLIGVNMGKKMKVHVTREDPLASDLLKEATAEVCGVTGYAAPAIQYQRSAGQREKAIEDAGSKEERPPTTETPRKKAASPVAGLDFSAFTKQT